MGQSIVTGIGGTLESHYFDSPALHQEASLQKICALEKKQAANKLIISSCTPNQATMRLLYGLYVLPTMLRYERTLYCLLLYYRYYCCCMYAYRCKCITPTNISPPWPLRTANITTEGMAF